MKEYIAYVEEQGKLKNVDVNGLRVYFGAYASFENDVSKKDLSTVFFVPTQAKIKSEEDGGGLWAGTAALILPAIALAAVQTAILTRVTRSAVIESMSEDYVRTARAKGLSKQQVLWRHVLRNAMIPVVTVMGLQFGNLITSAIVIENVFVLPGIGRLIFQAIANRDLIVVRDVVMLLSAMVILINFFIDLLYAWIDPRLKTGTPAV